MKSIRVAFTDWAGPNKKSITPQGYVCTWDKMPIYELLKKHFNVIVTDDNPDIIFSSAFGNRFLKYPNSVRVLVSWENVKPNFNLFDYAITLFPHYEYQSRHYYCDPNCLLDSKARFIHDLSLTKHSDIEISMAKRSSFCAYVVSNGKGRIERREIFLKLSEYKKVNSGGRYLNNIGETVSDKIEFLRKHKFSVAFENNMYYTSEKLQDCFAAKTIPIYWGDPNISMIYNSKAFINCHDFDNFDQVLCAVKEIDNNDELYMSMLAEPAFIKPKTSREYMCGLEDYLLKLVDTPKILAIQRDDIMHPAWQEKIAKYGWTIFTLRHHILIFKIKCVMSNGAKKIVNTFCKSKEKSE